MDDRNPEGSTLPVDPLPILEQRLGFLPNIFRAQASLTRAVAAQAGIADVVIFSSGALPRRFKEAILTAVAAMRRNVYCTTAHSHILATLGEDPGRIGSVAAGECPPGLSVAERSLFDFALTLGADSNRVGGREISRLREDGLTDERILEAILTVSLARFLCTLAEGLGPAPDFEPVEMPPGSCRSPAPSTEWAHGHSGGPHLAHPELGEEGFAPFAFFREHFGFVPNIFRAQTLRPDVLEAEVEAIRSILLPEDILSRRMKEFILLVVSARNLNTYCVAVHCELLRGLGVPEEISDQIALDHALAGLEPAESALLDFVLKLHDHPEQVRPGDLVALETHGWTGLQLLEAIVMAALSDFLNTLQRGLGTIPDFPPRLRFGPEAVDPGAAFGRPAFEASGPTPAPAADPDDPLVGRAREGDLKAFEELVVRHQSRIYRVILGVTASREDAEDGTQEVFIRAMRSLAEFRGTARFSTWLTRIAINEGLERIRRRRRSEALAEGDQGEEAFRPRHVAPWMENPEERFSREETRRLVEREILSLPLKYRSAVILKDVAQFSTPAAAEAMGLGVATFKTRLLRGRLMLREALAPHFARRDPGRTDDVQL